MAKLKNTGESAAYLPLHSQSQNQTERSTITDVSGIIAADTIQSQNDYTPSERDIVIDDIDVDMSSGRGSSIVEQDTLSAISNPILPATAMTTRTHTPYDPSTLQWDDYHALNKQNTYCYCGQDRVLDEFMLQCKKCHNWYHEHCLSIDIGKTIPFFNTYSFMCSLCTTNGYESYQRQPCAWKDVACTALANLILIEIKKHCSDLSAAALLENPFDTYYFLRDDVVAFVDSHWSALWASRAKVESIWKGTLSTTLYQYKEVFVTNDKIRITGSPFTLFDQNLFNIRPGHIDMFSKTGINGKLLPRASLHAFSGRSRERDRDRDRRYSQHTPLAPPSIPSSSASAFEFAPGLVTASGKRSTRSDRPILSQAQRQRLPTAVLPQQAADHPFNRDGYKYNLAQVNPYLRYAAYREFNSPPWLGPGVYMSREDRSPYVLMDRDGLTVWNDKGFRSARATIGVKEGDWYFEVFVNRGGGNKNSRNTNKIDKNAPCQSTAETLWPLQANNDQPMTSVTDVPTGDNLSASASLDEEQLSRASLLNKPQAKDDPHVRIGLSKREATLLGPIGYDSFGFGYRDSTGEKVSNSRPLPYGEDFATGDVIGVYVSLPPWTIRRRRHPPSSTSFNATTNGQHAEEGWVRPKSLMAAVRHKIPIKYKNYVFFESKDYLPLPDHPSPTTPATQLEQRHYPVIPRSRIIYFKNGKCQGTAFQDLPAPLPELCTLINARHNTSSSATTPSSSTIKTPNETSFPISHPTRQDHHDSKQPEMNQLPSTSEDMIDDGSLGYYPTVSMYRGGAVTMNFGPFFMYTPSPDFDPQTVQSNYLEHNQAASVSIDADAIVIEPSPSATIDDKLLKGQNDEMVTLMRTTPEELKLKVLLKSPLLPSQRWRPFAERFFEREVEETLCDLVDEVEYWHAYEFKQDKSLLTRHAVLYDRGGGVAVGPGATGVPTNCSTFGNIGTADSGSNSISTTLNGILGPVAGAMAGANNEEYDRQRMSMPQIQFEYPGPYDRFEMVEGEARVFDPAAPPSVWGLSNGTDRIYVKRRVRIKWASEAS